jgi:hypothetical protein
MDHPMTLALLIALAGSLVLMTVIVKKLEKSSLRVAEVGERCRALGHSPDGWPCWSGDRSDGGKQRPS